MMTSDVLEEWVAAECATYWNIEPSTWRSYVARKQAPQPKRRVGRTPVWDPEVVRAWKRSGQGARTDLSDARPRTARNRPPPVMGERAVPFS
jgi:hypothetical protein